MVVLCSVYRCWTWSTGQLDTHTKDLQNQPEPCCLQMFNHVAVVSVPFAHFPFYFLQTFPLFAFIRILKPIGGLMDFQVGDLIPGSTSGAFSGHGGRVQLCWRSASCACFDAFMFHPVGWTPNLVLIDWKQLCQKGREELTGVQLLHWRRMVLL